MRGKLLYRDAQGKPAELDLPTEGCFLGRGTDCAIRTDDAMVSRKNCKIGFASGRWVVEDLGSSNGTFVNEKKVVKHTLSHNDVVRCGSLQVRFIEAPGAPERPAARPASSVEVDPGLTGGHVSPSPRPAEADGLVAEERDQLAARLREASAEVEQAKLRLETEGAELARVRSELVTMRDKMADLERSKSMQEEELGAQIAVAEELRKELGELKIDYAATKARADEASEELAARDRQLERALEDVQRTKQMADEVRLSAAEVQKTKDEGWRELNARIEEIEHLREVISEQERMLEERRVGVLTLEATVKELRAERENQLRELTALRSERDELKERADRAKAHARAVEEEYGRSARQSTVGESEGEPEGLRNELRDVRIEQRKLEAERDRLLERIDRQEAERVGLTEKLAQLEVERTGLLQHRSGADAEQARLKEAATRAEAALARAEEERRKAAEARDSALAAADAQRREAERAQRRVKELDQLVAAAVQAKSAPAAAPAVAPPGATGAFEVPPDVRILQLEEELAKLGTELALAQAGGAPAADADAAGGGELAAEIRRRAEAAYGGINDLLSELRTNILLARDLVEEHGGAIADADATQALADAIAAVVDRTEEAKGLLRSLKEVVEGAQ